MESMEDNHRVLIEVRERLVRIETILNQIDISNVSKTAEEALQKSVENTKKIDELYGYLKWFVMLVLGAIFTAIMSVVLK